MPEEKIEKIEPINLSEDKEIAKIEEPTQRVTPDKEKFDQAFEAGKKPAQPLAVETQPQKASLMDTVRDLNYKDVKNPTPSHHSLISQTKEAVQQIEEIRKSLEAPNVTIKQSARQLLHNKLSHIDESLKVALSKAGVEYNPTAEIAKQGGRVNPIERFLSFLTDGQWQLERLGDQLGLMARQNKELSPVNMLAIQVKVGQIQQELDLFSTLLSKGLESIKTIMNIQV